MEELSQEEQYFKKWGYEPSDYTFWFDTENVFEIFRNYKYEYELRMIIFDETLLLKCRSEENDSGTVSPAFSTYWKSTVSYQIIAVIKTDQKLYYEFLRGIDICRFRDITVFEHDYTVFALMANDGESLVYYNKFGKEFESKEAAKEWSKVHNNNYLRSIEDTKLAQPTFYYFVNKDLQIIKLKGPVEICISYRSELAQYILSHKYRRDYDVIFMNKNSILLYIDGSVIQFNSYGVLCTGRKPDVVQEITEATELYYLVHRYFLLQEKNYSQNKIKSWEKYRAKGYDEELRPLVNEEIFRLKTQNFQQRANKIKENINKRQQEAFVNVQTYPTNGIDYIVPEQFYGNVHRTSSTTKEVVSHHRGKRVLAEVCSSCHLKFKYGWEYKDYFDNKIYVCSSCKAKLKDGKMNFHKMVITTQ